MHPQQVPSTAAVRRMPPIKAATATVIMKSVEAPGAGGLSAASTCTVIIDVSITSGMHVFITETQHV